MSLPDGRVIDFSYDDAGRLDLLNMSAGTYDYSYDAVDRLQSISAPGGENLRYDYDGPLVTQVTWSGPVSGSVQTAYDSDFRVTTQKVNNDYPVTYHYDQDGLLDHYTIAGAGGANPATMFIERDPANGLVTGTTVGVVTDSRQYNEHGELSHYTARANGTVVFEVDYVRDQLGRIDFKTETVQGVTKAFDYEYDLVGRLTDVWEDAVLVEHYEYDPNGNRTLGMVRGVTSIGTYDDQDRLLSYGRFAYTYNASGDLETKTNTVTSEMTAYSYDEFGNLREVWLPNGDHLEYVIDGRNRRVGKRVNGALVQGFVFGDQLDPAAELDGMGRIVGRFGYGTVGHSPDVVEKDGIWHRVIADHLGSPRIIVTEATGGVVQRLDYDSWGEVVASSAPDWQPFGFIGGIDDGGVDLVRFGTRDYDRQSGRWTTRDRVRVSASETNPYVYVGNGPVERIDPLGLYFKNPTADQLAAINRLATNPEIGAAIIFLRDSPDVGIQFKTRHSELSLRNPAFTERYAETGFGIAYDVELANAGGFLFGQIESTTLDDVIAHELGHVWGVLQGLDDLSNNVLSVEFENASRRAEVRRRSAARGSLECGRLRTMHDL